MIRRRTWTWAHRTVAAAFLALLVLGRQDWFPWVKGGVGSTRVFDLLPFADPLSALEIALASGQMTDLLLGGGLLVLGIYVVLGRFFCGWLCPLGLLCDLNEDLRALLARGVRRSGGRLPAWRAPLSLKYWLLAFVLLLSLFASLPVFTTISPINVVVWAAVFGAGPELIAVALILVAEWFSPRVFCRALCPVGAFYALAGRVALLRIRINPATAGQKLCRQCTTHCPMGIAVMESYAAAGKPDVSDPECTRCGTCVDFCRNDVLRLGFRPTPPPAGPVEAECPGCGVPTEVS